MDMKAAWEAISAYLTREDLHEDDCSLYGPWAPPESELQLLGETRNQAILEVGCGAGQCSIALARQGARVTGLDLSAGQLAAAAARAAAAGVEVEWVEGSVEDLTSLSQMNFDLVIASYVLPYVTDLPGAFRAMAGVLKPGGRLIYALDHPLRTCFFDDVDEELVSYPSRSYFAADPFRWSYPGPEIRLASQHRTIARWLDLGQEAGLRLVRLVEPEPPQALLDELWPEDDPRAPLRNLPQAIIFIMEKPPAENG